MLRKIMVGGWVNITAAVRSQENEIKAVFHVFISKIKK